MKKKHNQFIRAHDWNAVKEIFTAAELVERCLEGADYERGQIEELNAGIKNLLAGFARLTEILYHKKILDRSEVYAVAGESEPSDE
jgi:hypothetical protein